MVTTEQAEENALSVFAWRQAFRILDPKGVLLETLSEPVKEVGTCWRCKARTLELIDVCAFFHPGTQYLRNRKDTVRCIVVSLTDDQHGDLFEELRRNNMRLIQQDDDSDDDEVG